MKFSKEFHYIFSVPYKLGNLTATNFYNALRYKANGKEIDLCTRDGTVGWKVDPSKVNSVQEYSDVEYTNIIFNCKCTFSELKLYLSYEDLADLNANVGGSLHTFLPIDMNIVSAVCGKQREIWKC